MDTSTRGGGQVCRTEMLGKWKWNGMIVTIVRFLPNSSWPTPPICLVAGFQSSFALPNFMYSMFNYFPTFIRSNCFSRVDPHVVFKPYVQVEESVVGLLSSPFPTSLLLSLPSDLFVYLCLYVPPASSHSLIVASHTVYTVASLCEDELLYFFGARTAGKACSMVRFVACEG